MRASGRTATGVRPLARRSAALCLLLALGGAVRTADGDARGFLAASHADGSSMLRAWIQVDARRTLFYTVSLDRRGAVTGVRLSRMRDAFRRASAQGRRSGTHA